MVGLNFHELEPLEFEEMIASLMIQLGYEDVKNRQGSNDGGIDVEATSRSAISINQIAIQCKRYADNKVRLHHVRNLDSAVRNENFTTGIIITSGDFTPDAIEYAAKSSVKIQLIDGEHLTALINRAFPKISNIRDILALDLLQEQAQGSNKSNKKNNLLKRIRNDPLGMDQPVLIDKFSANNVEPGTMMTIEGFNVKLVNQRQIINLKLPKVNQYCSSCGMQLRGELRYCVKDDWFFGKNFDGSHYSGKKIYCEHHSTVELKGNRHYCHKCDWHYK